MDENRSGTALGACPSSVTARAARPIVTHTDPAAEVSVPAVLHGAAGDAIGPAHALGTPQQPIAMYARWWQLEAWVRDRIYMALRAAFGIEWTDAVRRANDEKSATLPSRAWRASTKTTRHPRPARALSRCCSPGTERAAARHRSLLIVTDSARNTRGNDGSDAGRSEPMQYRHEHSRVVTVR